jgi:hypothetical protein
MELCRSVCYDFSDIGYFRQGTVLAVPSPRYDSRALTAEGMISSFCGTRSQYAAPEDLCRQRNHRGKTFQHIPRLRRLDEPREK